VEIWNIVFNEYFCDGSREKFDKGEANLSKLQTFGVDTGMGEERLLTIINKKESVYETDLFEDVISFIKEKSKKYKI
jgi:alanyl-tRNA synthetase